MKYPCYPKKLMDFMKSSPTTKGIFITNIKDNTKKSYRSTKDLKYIKCLNKHNKSAEGIILADFKMYYKSILIQSTVEWNKGCRSRPMQF